MAKRGIFWGIMNKSVFVAKLVLTVLSVFVQLAATGILLFVAMGAITALFGSAERGQR